ncbi:hypothetical protein NL108_018415 [Boleophthalmus pectinirostris]|nr:hypothetical protein NL108_018415 [Boleophthalmus pectinirostris]
MLDCSSSQTAVSGLTSDKRCSAHAAPGGGRSADLVERKAALEREYKDELLRRCCVDGLRDIPMRYSCTRRSLYISEGVECIRAFRHCCGKYRGEPIDPHMPTAMPSFITTTTTPTPTTRLKIIPFRGRFEDRVRVYSRVLEMPVRTADLGRPREPPLRGEHGSIGEARTDTPTQQEDLYEEDWEDEDLDETMVDLRSKFQESWLWEDLPVPSKSDHSTGLSSVTVERPLPDSITEWGIMAISTSAQTGFCVAEPYNVRAWKPLFVDLKLPYSVARNEQVQIRAVVYNYSPDNREVRVTLKRTEQMCSVAFRDSFVQEVLVESGSSVVLPFTVVPLAVGHLPLEVIVVTKDMMMTDGVQKNLRVVMEGVQKTKVWSVVLNPAAEGGLFILILLHVWFTLNSGVLSLL